MSCHCHQHQNDLYLYLLLSLKFSQPTKRLLYLATPFIKRMEKEKTTTWEENIYWGHFSTFHFAQFLLTDFQDHLDIPEKFTSNLKHKLPGTATLRGPTGIAWNVELVGDGDDDTLAFKHGWKQFVHDNSLVENDFLVFKYNGESLFDVLMFDARSLCEKVATYFVREPGGAKNAGTERQTEGRNETSGEVVLNSSPDVVALLGPKHRDEDDEDDDDFTAPTEQNGSLQLIEKEVTTTKAQCVSCPTRRGSRTRRPSRAMMLSKPDDLDGGPCYAKRRKGCASAKQYVLKRRPITEEEKKKALEAAKAAAANNESAVVIMRPSSVHKKFFAVIPIDWLRKHVRPENQDVILRRENRTWHARFNYVKSRRYGGLCGGWKDFVVDNNLEEHDVCVLELAPGSYIQMIIDVTIFRVVEDTTPVMGVF